MLSLIFYEFLMYFWKSWQVKLALGLFCFCYAGVLPGRTLSKGGCVIVLREENLWRSKTNIEHSSLTLHEICNCQRFVKSKW